MLCVGDTSRVGGRPQHTCGSWMLTCMRFPAPGAGGFAQEDLSELRVYETFSFFGSGCM